jgi:hypothetical protein
MVPVSPIIKRNTVNNIEATLGLETVLGHPVFKTTSHTCQWSPDPAVPDPVIQDLWNSPYDLDEFYDDRDEDTQIYEITGDDVFDSNNVPTHINPVQVNDTHFMCIRLSDCLRSRPVRISFYLGSKHTDPMLRFLPVKDHSSGPQLVFPVTADEEIVLEWYEERGRTRSVRWTVPNGPEDSWVFAIEIPEATVDVPQALLAAIENFVQQDSTDLEALTEQHPNVIGRKLKLPVDL